VDDDDLAHVRDAFGWGAADVAVSTGPRGALGQIWRLDVGRSRYALKEIFAEPPSPSPSAIEAELAFARRATAAGVRLPASHPDHAGTYLLTTPAGTWLRLYDWVDVAPVDRTSPATPAQLGELLARLHRCAPTAVGQPVDRWYDHVPTATDWAEVSASDTAWAPALARLLPTLPALCASVAPSDPAELIVCHRDLHPENVLTDPAGALVVVDWDDTGPAVPGRELVHMLFDWYCDGPTADLDAMRALYDAYVRAGGPGRVTGPADFSMLLATRLHFLLLQAEVAVDPDTEDQDREWAEREIDEALRILPTTGQLSEVLAQVPTPPDAPEYASGPAPATTGARRAVPAAPDGGCGGDHHGERRPTPGSRRPGDPSPGSRHSPSGTDPGGHAGTCCPR
jgi:Ser/Thr protein kinase RdoA (MazF antagonist)